MAGLTPVPLQGGRLLIFLRDTAMFYSLTFLEHSKEQKAALGCCGAVRPSLGGQLSEAVQAGVGVGWETLGARETAP